MLPPSIIMFQQIGSCSEPHLEIGQSSDIRPNKEPSTHSPSWSVFRLFITCYLNESKELSRKVSSVRPLGTLSPDIYWPRYLIQSLPCCLVREREKNNTSFEGGRTSQILRQILWYPHPMTSTFPPLLHPVIHKSLCENSCPCFHTL